MSKHNVPNPLSSGLPRQAFLKGAAVAGAGVLWTMSGSTLSTSAMAQQDNRAAAHRADFSFVQISDTHVGAKTPANPNVLGTFEQAIHHINALPQRPAFVVHTGDHAHLGTTSELDTAKQLLGTIKTDRVFNLPGEHDVFVDQGKAYRQIFAKGTHGNGYWSFDRSGVHFIGLVNDAGAVGTGQGTLGAAQLAFVQHDLAHRSSDTPLVLFSHVPLLPIYVLWGWATSDGAALLAPGQALYGGHGCPQRPHSPTDHGAAGECRHADDQLHRLSR